MLQQKYMPEFHFVEKHAVNIGATPEKTYACLQNFDFGNSVISRILMRLRGMPASANRLEDLRKMGFILLEMKQNEEVILGLVGQFWRPSGNIQHLSKEAFVTFNDPHFVRATWNFLVRPHHQHVTLETETRILCGSLVMNKFKWYWSIVRPFSGIIRKEMLKGIKREVQLNDGN